MDMTVHTLVIAYQKMCVCFKMPQNAQHPNVSPLPLPVVKERVPPKGNKDPEVGEPPQPVPKAPSSLSLGGVVQPGSLQVLTGGPGLRLAAWGPVRWESGSPSEELIHCLYQSWGGEQQGEGEIPQGKFGNQDSPAPESPLASRRGATPSLCVNVGAHVCGCLPGCSIYVCVFTVWCLHVKW